MTMAEIAEALATATESNIDAVAREAWTTFTREGQFFILQRSRIYCQRLAHRGRPCPSTINQWCDGGAAEAVADAIVARAIGTPADPNATAAQRVRQAHNSWLAHWHRRRAAAAHITWLQFVGQLTRQWGEESIRAWNRARGLYQTIHRPKRRLANFPNVFNLMAAMTVEEAWAHAYEQFLVARGIEVEARELGLGGADATGGLRAHPVDVWWRVLYADACQTASAAMDTVRVARHLHGLVLKRGDWPDPRPVLLDASFNGPLMDFVNDWAGEIDTLIEAFDPPSYADSIGRARDLTRIREGHEPDRDDDPWNDVGLDDMTPGAIDPAEAADEDEDDE